jgi:hypothetical protein
MKIKTTVGILAAFAVMTLGACTGGEDTPEDAPETPPAKPTDPMATGGELGDYILTGGVWEEVHIFTTSGSLNMTRASAAATVLVVAGGGGGGTAFDAFPTIGAIGGGGGAGGLIYTEDYTLAEGDHAVLVGKGGAIFTNGTDSQFDGNASLRAIGGGRGGRDNGVSGANNLGQTGGSGGGSSYLMDVLNNGTPSQGHSGGIAADMCSGGGGGGAGEPGAAAAGTYKGAKGGDGLSYPIRNDEQVWYAGGGASGASGLQGTGGVLNGDVYEYAGGQGGGGGSGQPGEDGLGGGGSGASGATTSARPGGSGIVIVRFPWTAPTEGEQETEER